MIWDMTREFLQNVFTAIGLFWTIRYGIPEFLRRLIGKYDKRPLGAERT